MVIWCELTVFAQNYQNICSKKLSIFVFFKPKVLQRLSYIFLYPLILLFSRLTFWILYRIADLLYIVIYYIAGYRKKVVRRNLLLAFPDKNDSERKTIEKKFYRHFADLFIEMIKAFQMRLPQMQKHFVFNNVELLNNLTSAGKDIIVVGGHYANWEWVFSLAALTKAFPIATYLKINNPYIEKFMLKNRSRFGGELIETKNLRKTLKKYVFQDRRFILGLLADQSPQRHKAKYWRAFFDTSPVPVFTGPEELAKQYNTAFVFMKINKLKRGYYSVDFELITENPTEFENYDLTDIYIQKLEQQIKTEPSYYLWTHNRFKHLNKMPANKKVVVK